MSDRNYDSQVNIERADGSRYSEHSSSSTVLDSDGVYRTVKTVTVEKTRASRAERKDFAISVTSTVASIVLFLCFGIPVIQVLFGGDVTVFSLESIINLLQGAPSIPMDWLNAAFETVSIPFIAETNSFIDPLIVSINVIIHVLNLVLDFLVFVGWIGAGAINGITFISYFAMTMAGGVA